jgi:hypothetical protein
MKQSKTMQYCDLWVFFEKKCERLKRNSIFAFRFEKHSCLLVEKF